MSKEEDFEKDYNAFQEKYKDTKLHHYQDQPVFTAKDKLVDALCKAVIIIGCIAAAGLMIGLGFGLWSIVNKL